MGFIFGLGIVSLIFFVIVSILSIEKQLRQLNRTNERIADLLKEIKNGKDTGVRILLLYGFENFFVELISMLA